MAHKVIVVGDVNGHLKDIFHRLATLHSKQNFAFAIIAGNLFADPTQPTLESNEQLAKLLAGEIEVALPTYFTLGKRALPDGVINQLERDAGELVPNLACLGRRTRIKTSEGITILTIGGVRQETPPEQPPEPWSSEYVDKDVFQAISFNDADILITSDWPADVKAGSRVPCAGASTEEVQSLSKLCSEIKPRYHFSTSPAFYEREPFFHDLESKAQVTRFIALAAYGNINKEKYIYAFSLQPGSISDDQSPPPGTTASPFLQYRKRKLDSQQAAFNHFRYSNGNGHSDRGTHEHRGKRKRSAAPLQPRECYFCLSNPACETHMIGSIGNDAYVTVAKGPLPTRSTYPPLGFPGHLLIIPLIHTPTLLSIPDTDTQTATKIEMKRYLDALHVMVLSRSDGGMGSIAWDISRASGVHNHWQFLPFPTSLLDNGTAEAAFKQEADSQDYPAFRDEEPEVAEIEKSDHFKVILQSDKKKKVMVMPLDQSFRFDLQFARRVLAKLLGLADRSNWRDCGQTKMDEEADTLRFKEAFKEFDFSLED